MSNTETRTLEEVVLGLAERLKTSCGYDGGPDLCACADHDCPCHSIGFQEVHGQVPEFPMLRRPCGRLHTVWNPANAVGISSEVRFVDHDEAGCRGWLPVCSTDALLEGLKPYSFWLNWSVGLRCWVVAKSDLVLGLRVIATGDSPQMVLALVLEAASKENSPYILTWQKE